MILSGVIVNLPAADLATLAIVNPPAGTIKVRTPLMRISQDEMARRPHRYGMPTEWAPTLDGRVQVWPEPDRAWPAEARLRDGRDPENVRPVARLVPVEAQIEAFAVQARAAQASRAGETQRVERFSLLGEE